MKLSWKWSCLALVSDTGVKSVMSTVAVKVNFLRKTDVERVVAHVEAVELTREVRVPDVVDLRNSGQRRFGRYVRSGVFSSDHHGHGTDCQIFKEKFNSIESKFQGIWWNAISKKWMKFLEIFRSAESLNCCHIDTIRRILPMRNRHSDSVADPAISELSWHVRNESADFD